MKIGGEEVELVTDFATLRAGMIVWVKPCLWGCDKHRYILLGATTANYGPAGPTLPSPALVALPSSRYCPSTARLRSVSERTVSERRAYRVVDPHLDAKTTTRARELTRG